MRAKDDEKYAGEGLNFAFIGNEPPNAVIHSRFRRLLPIYVVPDDKRIVSKSLEWLTKQAEDDVEFIFYDLVYLFQQLIQTAPMDIPAKMSMGAAESHLMR